MGQNVENCNKETDKLQVEKQPSDTSPKPNNKILNR